MDTPIMFGCPLYTWMPTYLWMAPCMFGFPHYVWIPQCLEPPVGFDAPIVWTSPMFGCLPVYLATPYVWMPNIFGCTPCMFGSPNVWDKPL